ncbi:GNAT family N-acetyltransferase [Planosporangium thailandense]|uniref:GNAT family N-acetyltransferase n=1 Tax=Planosporangium thailandense TaxID=765197 RepID=A0ABX0XRA2_9ACTN|nr:GNAT family N-acetyltransferase [Planosporangium thailandense]NJC68422.1 GNAT family N-acetyltransferase [Planosporangium thailandense]
MPQLTAPTAAVRRSYLAGLAEFRAEGRLGPDDHSMLGWAARDVPEDPAGFERYTAMIRALALPDGPRPEGWVPCSELWYVDDDEWLGHLNLRHRLTPGLLEVGGHIGYDVRPSARRRGHATAMLREGLAVARSLGIESALLTCDHDNAASRRVIEKAGGVLEDQRGDKLRFWVPTEG